MAGTTLTAKVNGQLINTFATEQEVEMLRPRVAQSFPTATPGQIEAKVREWALDNLIERALLQQEALRDPEPLPLNLLRDRMASLARKWSGQQVDLKSLRTLAEISLRVERLIDRVTGHVAAPDEEQIRQHYENNCERFRQPDSIHASHIVAHARTAAEVPTASEKIHRAKKELESGRSFADVANDWSECPGNGGDLGFFPSGEMVQEFETVVQRLREGEISDIFQTPFGFHIAKLHERVPGQIAPLELVRTRIGSDILNRRKREAMEAFIDDLRRRSEVTYE